MGANCLGCSQTNKKKPKYSIQPEDTSDYNPDKLSHRLRKLNFRGELDNVEISNYPFDIISIDFKIVDVFECTLPRQRKPMNQNSNHNGNQMGVWNRMKWKFIHGFEMRMDEYQIRKSFIIISIYNQLPQPVIIQRLNLYQVITGPYHHDIAIKFQNKPTSRLLFDLKISQYFNVVINPIQVGVHLNQQYPGDQFNYSFNAYKCGQKISASDGSLPQKVLIFSNVEGNYRQLREEDECQSPTKIRKGTNMNKMIRNAMTSQLIWNRPKQIVIKSIFKEPQIQIPVQEEIAMPSFKLQLSSNQISKSSLQMILWKIQLDKMLGLSQGIMFADCYITFPKLFQTDYLSVQEQQTDGSDKNEENHHSRKKVINRYQSRICIIQEALIKQGRSIGKVSLKLRVINQIYFSQLYLHARTQDGIVYMNSMFKTYVGKQRSAAKTESINKIQASTEKLISYLYSIINLSSQKKRNWPQFTSIEEKAIEEFHILMSLLSISIEESFVIVQKHNLEQMMQRQLVFMSIVEKLLLFLQKDSIHFLQQLWKVILLIVKRGQFYLQNIGFAQIDHSSSSNRQKSNDPSEPNTGVVLPKKIRIALRYQQMMYKILIIALNYNYETQRDTIIQAQAFKAFGYFRIPKFRQEVLRCIVRSAQQVQFAQHKIECFEANNHMNNAILKYEEKSSSHLDWQKNFYSYLRQQRKSHELDMMLLDQLKETQWFMSIGERKESFFIFIEYFTKKMAELSKRLKLIRYSYCPGYDKLVKTFLIEMKRKPLVQYESCMIETSTALLANHSLIKIVIPIVVQKTNLYDNQSIKQFLNILTSYLKFLTENGQKTLPQKFNHHYFFKIIKLILECQYSYAVSKMLVILHTYFQCFNDQFKDVLCLYLLSKAFFRLFFHWSFSIRIIFYHFFIIKIYWSKLNGVTEKYNKMNEYHNENCQIFNRYKKLIKILNTAEKQKSIKKKNMKRAQKQEYYVKMKRKILAKINQNPQNMNRRDDINDSGIESSSSELSNDKQKTLNLTRLQTLCESKNGYNRSETLCSSQIKQHLKKLQSQRTKSFSSMSIDEGTEKTLKSSKNSEQHVEYGINLKTKHKKSLESKKSGDGDTDNSVRQEIQKINEDYIKKLSLVHLNRKMSSSEDKPLVYTFFGNQDYQLEEISLNQENKILLGMEEFRQTQEFVEKYILQKGVAPHVNLDPEIELDTSEFKPLEISTL